MSARHLDKPTCRLIAAAASLLGVIPLVLVLTEPGARQPAGVVVTVVIALCANGVAVVWATQCWPTRRQSGGCAILATICIAAAVAVIPNPLVAALGVLAFTGPAGFGALFHTRQLLIGTWAIAASTLILSAWRLATANLTLAAVVMPMVLIVNVFATCAWLLVLHLTPTKVSSALTDPLTGLYNRAGFQDRMTTILGARERAQDLYLVIVVIAIDTYALLMSLGDARADDTARTAARQLQGTVRRDSVLAYRGDGEFLLAELFSVPDPAAMLERLRGVLTDRPAQLSASIGAVSTPLTPLTGHPVDEVLTELVHLADTAVSTAHHAGGNTVRATLDPTLAIPDEDDPRTAA